MGGMRHDMVYTPVGKYKAVSSSSSRFGRLTGSGKRYCCGCPMISLQLHKCVLKPINQSMRFQEAEWIRSAIFQASKYRCPHSIDVFSQLSPSFSAKVRIQFVPRVSDDVCQIECVHQAPVDDELGSYLDENVEREWHTLILDAVIGEEYHAGEE